jgi:hypothetical protein
MYKRQDLRGLQGSQILFDMLLNVDVADHVHKGCQQPECWFERSLGLFSKGEKQGSLNPVDAVHLCTV